jgi:hypothetical protein
VVALGRARSEPRSWAILSEPMSHDLRPQDVHARRHRALRARLMRPVPLLAIAIALALVGPTASDSAELSAFMVTGSPGTWGTGFGGALTITILDIAAVEGEIANMVGEFPADGDMWTASGAALIRPSLGRFQPFGGLAVGVYRQSFVGHDVNGTMSALVLGLKIKLVLGIGVKGEYRRVGLTDVPFVPLHDRYTLGATLTF